MTRFPRVRGISGEQRARRSSSLPLVKPILFMMLTAGMMELARGVWIYNSVSHAAREGCRYAIVNGGESGHIQDGHPRSRTTCRPAFSSQRRRHDDVADVKTPGTVVTVTVDFDFEPVIAFFPAVAL